MSRSARLVVIAAAGCFLLIPISCSSRKAVMPGDTKAIAEEAFIYAYPLLANYRSLYVTMINENSPYYRAPCNQIVHDTRLADHTRKDVVAMNADTLYSNFGLDLRAEPVVISVPDVPDRYYVMQCVDMYTHNFAYVGTRATGNKAGHYLIVGPKWKGKIPEGRFDKVFRCESEFGGIVGRTQVKSADDLPNVKAVLKGYKVTPLSVFMGNAAKPAPPMDWPKWNPKVMNSPEFIGLLNFLLATCEPIHHDDRPLLRRFAEIGIAPGKPFDAGKLDPELSKAIQGGIDAAVRKITHKVENIGTQVNGWNMTDAIGPREFFKGGNWLLRAAAAQSAMYMNDKIEAFYPLVFVDGDGKTLDGKGANYILHFKKEQIPPAKYFWSVTMYDKSADGTAGYMVDNPIGRYLVSSATEGLIYGEDGSLTIYIQHEKPEGDKAANWLPAPAEPFYMAMRIYGPDKRVLSGQWAPPPVLRQK